MANADELATALITNAEGEHPGELGLHPGSFIGRYIVLEYLGQGAYGEVHSAFDPELDRRIAIKLLRRHSTRGTRALVREAQAMAKLNHPNVVAVHDVGTAQFEGRGEPRLFIAMQYVSGGTLRDWWSDRSRTWEEIVAMFVQAGRGLAAAHAQGLVHRDFKPDNVLVGDDGRVRVTDFGLARSLEELRELDDEDLARTSEITPGSAKQRGILPIDRWCGTPAYMAPEQFRGGTIDHVTDQFCFCICFFEALFGARPFPGTTAMEIAQHVCAGEMIAPLGDIEVPRRIVDVVLRGLAREREARFADMYELLAALDPPQRRVWPAASLATAIVVGAVALFAYRQASTHGPDPCVDAGSEIDVLWSDARRSDLERSILRTAAPGAAETAGLVIADLDRYAREWKEARSRSCVEQAAAVEPRDFDLRRAWCLDRRFAAFAARTEALVDVEREQVGNLVATFSSLAPVSDCDDLDELARIDMLAVSESADVRGFERQLERILALIESGAYGRAQSLLDPVAKPILELDDGPLIAQFEYLRGRIATEQHQPERAAPALRRAYFIGLRWGNDAAAVQAAGLLARTTSSDLDRLDEARDWARHGKALAERVGRAELIGRAENAAGFTAYRGGDLEEALEHFNRTRDRYVEAYGPEHFYVGRAELNLAAILLTMQRYEESLPHYQAGARIIAATLGPTHVDNVTVHLNYGLTLSKLGREVEARAEFEAALKLLDERDEHGDDFTRALVHNGLGDLDSRAGDWRAASRHFDAMLELMRAAVGETKSFTANAMVASASARVRLGRVDEALPRLEAAVATLEALAVPAEELANARAELAIGLWTKGVELERARSLMTQALDSLAEQRLEVPPQVSNWLAKHPELGVSPNP